MALLQDYETELTVSRFYTGTPNKTVVTLVRSSAVKELDLARTRCIPKRSCKDMDAVTRYLTSGALLILNLASSCYLCYTEMRVLSRVWGANSSQSVARFGRVALGIVTKCLAQHLVWWSSS